MNEKGYEQDIRELLMAFYPGETFSHPDPEGYRPNDDTLLTVKAIMDEDAGTMTITVETPSSPEAADSLADAGQESASDMVQHKIDTTADIAVINLVPGDRVASKNEIKRRLYDILSARTGKTLPWGTLTGIRPTKIALTRLDEGMSPEDISLFMQENYYTSAQKADLSVKIALREKDMLSKLNASSGYSLYIGIPFCPTTCLYCSFTSYPISQWKDRTDLYLNALFKELDYVAEKKKGSPLETIYIGGGTPTSLCAEDIDKLLTKIEDTFDLSHLLEFTVEAGRPDSITREKLIVLKAHNVTRISINPQTMKEETLRLIGRKHTIADVIDRFYMARELGFDDINMDLIIGLPEEDEEDVRMTMEQITKLRPENLTVHTLAIKRAARLNTMRELYKDLKITGTQEMIDISASYARAMGLEPYYLYRQKNMAGNFENVGYALPGKACIYNVLIMEERQTIIGCGAGTTTKRLYPEENRIERAENVKNVEQYIDRIDEMIARKERIL